MVDSGLVVVTVVPVVLDVGSGDVVDTVVPYKFKYQLEHNILSVSWWCQSIRPVIIHIYLNLYHN